MRPWIKVRRSRLSKPTYRMVKRQLGWMLEDEKVARAELQLFGALVEAGRVHVAKKRRRLRELVSERRRVERELYKLKLKKPRS